MTTNHNATWAEQASAPDTPDTGKWKLYFKSDGLYIVDDTGTETGPLGTGGGSPSLDGEIFIPAASMWPSTVGGAADAAKFEYGANDVDLYVLAFNQAADEYAQFNVWMPDTWDGGTVTFKAAWMAAGGSGNVIWGLQGRAFANDDAIDQAWGTAQTVTDTLLATGDMHYTAESSAITLAGGPTAGELVQFRVYRDADNGSDTLSDDALLIGLKIYYTKSA